MFGHLRPVRSVGLGVLGSGLLFAACVLGTGGAKRFRVSGVALAQARGSNVGLVLTQSSCNAFQGFAPCTVPNVACFNCGNSTYTNVMGGNNGGYDAGGQGAGRCGGIWLGSCNANLVCVNQLPGRGNCNNPIGPPLVQP